MPHSFGYRARTRNLFSKKFRKHGAPALGTYLRTYKRGDVVDVVGDGAIHKGMPHKYYHGKTGRVWNVAKRAIGVIINKKVGGKILPKKIHVRVEHVQPSKSRAGFKERVKANTELYKKWKAEGGAKPLFKRLPVAPGNGGIVQTSKAKVEQLHAEAFISFYV